MRRDASVVQTFLNKVDFVVDIITHFVTEVFPKIRVCFGENSEFSLVDIECLCYVFGKLLIFLTDQLEHLVVLWIPPKMVQFKIWYFNKIYVLEDVVSSSEGKFEPLFLSAAELKQIKVSEALRILGQNGAIILLALSYVFQEHIENIDVFNNFLEGWHTLLTFHWRIATYEAVTLQVVDETSSTHKAVLSF